MFTVNIAATISLLNNDTNGTKNMLHVGLSKRMHKAEIRKPMKKAIPKEAIAYFRVIGLPVIIS